MSDDLEIPVPTGQSLSDRMERRALVRASDDTEFFPLPGFEGLVEVELRATGQKVMAHLEQKLSKVRDPILRDQYLKVDMILTATVGFHEVDQSNPERRTPISDGWVELALKYRPVVNSETGARKEPPVNPSQRQAFLHLIEDRFLNRFSNEYGIWSSGMNGTVDDEVVADFGTTG